MSAARISHASGSLRDQFLSALDAEDHATYTALAVHLTSCTNPLPTMACDQLGLPTRSTYASAAHHVLAAASV